jgi:alpha-L-fucosidase
MAQYGKTSPWGNTDFTSTGELDLLSIRPVPAEDDDILYTIEPQYTYRPDLLAFDLYGTAKLWWIFAQRNIDTLKDPVFDFIPGTKIYLPKSSAVKKGLNL